jgi:hypothetical protein
VKSIGIDKSVDSKISPQIFSNRDMILIIFDKLILVLWIKFAGLGWRLVGVGKRVERMLVHREIGWLSAWLGFYKEIL